MAIETGDDREFALTAADFETLRTLVHEWTGIALSPQKQDMVYNRLARRLRVLGLDTFAAYLDRLRGPEGAAEMGILINAITTNLTRFFREPHHFDHLRDVAVPDTLNRIKSGTRARLRVWSAGCSSGEEPYTIAMVLAEAGATRARIDARILATDLDTDMLRTGAEGVYTNDVLDGLPPDLRQRYTAPCPTPQDKPGGRMSDPLRQLVAFKQLNLMKPWPMKGMFDAIFCRNVMIYFDHQTRDWLVQRFHAHLRPGGWLYTGHAESLAVKEGSFTAEGRTIYRKVA